MPRISQYSLYPGFLVLGFFQIFHFYKYFPHLLCIALLGTDAKKRHPLRLGSMCNTVYRYARPLSKNPFLHLCEINKQTKINKHERTSFLLYLEALAVLLFARNTTTPKSVVTILSYCSIADAFLFLASKATIQVFLKDDKHAHLPRNRKQNQKILEQIFIQVNIACNIFSLFCVRFSYS